MSSEWLDRIIQNIVRSMHEESSISYFMSILSLLFVLPSHLCLCSNVCPTDFSFIFLSYVFNGLYSFSRNLIRLFAVDVNSTRLVD